MKLALTADQSADGFYVLINLDTWRPGATMSVLAGSPRQGTGLAPVRCAGSHEPERWYIRCSFKPRAPLVASATCNRQSGGASCRGRSCLTSAPGAGTSRRLRPVHRTTRATTSPASVAIRRSAWSCSCLADVPTSLARTAPCACRCHLLSRPSSKSEHSAVQSRRPVPVKPVWPC